MTSPTTDTGAMVRRYLSLTFNVLIWLIVAIDAWYLWPTSLHGSTSMVVVSGHSMEPTYFTGDLVIARKMAPSVGDVIVYAPEGFGGSQIVHRIIGGDAEQGWVMQGDNNDNEDPFTPKGDEIKGVVLVHYANFGRVTVLLLNPMVWAFILLASIVLLVWWSSDSCDEDDDDEDTDTHAHETEPEPEEELDLIDRMVEGAEAAIARMGASIAGVGAAVLASLKRRSSAARHSMSAPLRKAPLYLRTSAMVAVLGLVAVLVPSVASASSLTVNTGGNAFTKTFAPCTTATLTATPSVRSSGTVYTTLTVSGIPAQCNGLPIRMAAHNSAGASLISSAAGATTGTSGSVSFTKTTGFDAKQVVKVYVFIDTWGIPTTWSYTPQSPPDPAVGKCEGYLMTTGEIPSGTTCVLTTSVGGLENLDVYNGGPGNFRSVQMSTEFTPGGYFAGPGSSNWRNYQDVTLWRTTLNLQASLAGIDFAGGYYIYNNNNAGLAPGEDCSDPTAVTFQERTAGSDPSAGVVVSDAPITWMQPSQLMCSHL